MAIPVLVYHNVSNKFELGIARNTVRQFSKQMLWLYRNGYKTITPSAFFLAKEHHDPNNKCVIITFDDTYANIITAARIMAEFKFVGCSFVVSNFIGLQNEWDYQIFRKKLRHANQQQILNLQALGWEIGSHTHTHPHLPDLTRSQIQDELHTSRKRLGDICDTEIYSISYPFGRANEHIQRLAEEAGYRIGFSLGVKPDFSSSLNIPRLGIYLSDPIKIFAHKVQSALNGKRFYYNLQRYISAFSYGTVILNRVKNRF